MAANRYDMIRDRAAQTAQVEKQQAGTALTRKFARMGNLNSGAYVQASQAADQDVENRKAGQLADINFAEAGEQHQDEQAQKQREFQTNERLGSQTFGAGEAEKGRGFQSSENALGRRFATSEREAGQGYQSGENALQRRFATSEREAGQAYGTGERLGSQDFASRQAGDARYFAREERQAGQKFAADERYINNEQNRQLADRQYGLDLDVTQANQIAAEKAGRKSWLESANWGKKWLTQGFGK
jgi:hypothetical protein